MQQPPYTLNTRRGRRNTAPTSPIVVHRAYFRDILSVVTVYTDNDVRIVPETSPVIFTTEKHQLVSKTAGQ